jgi:putative flippase GtrA
MASLFRQFLQREAHPGIQFIKYAVAGCIATAVDILTVFVLAWKLLPALMPGELLVRLFHIEVAALNDSVRARNYVLCKVLAFFVSNTTAYLIDRVWVFHPGRHSQRREFTLFFLVSFISMALGTALAWVLIHFFGMSTAAAYGANAVASLSVNFAGRKFFVFQR